jgi:hypothetical protein
MFVYELFKPMAEDGMIFSLRPTSPATFSPFRWDSASRKWMLAQIPMSRFMAMSGATVAQLQAVGLSAGGNSQH